MKEPLGVIDTRVEMTDPNPDGLLSSSFSSAIAFDDPPQYTTNPVEDFRTLDFGPKRHAATDEIGDATSERDKERAHPRLDVALDKYHMLDGFAEPLNPQNTPASYSGCNSPGEMTTRGNNENLRSRSAPASRALGSNWSEDQPDTDLIYLHGDGDDELQAQKLHAPETSQLSSASSPDATKNVQTAADGRTSKEAIGDAAVLLRSVRFSPPLKSTQRRTVDPAQRPIPSVERKQDYIASYRQHKQRERWGSPNRPRVQRYNPYRSPEKIPRSLMTHANGQSDVRFSPGANLPSQRNERSRSPSPENRNQPTSVQEGSGVTSAPTDNLECSHTNSLVRQEYELAQVSFSLYQYRMAGTWRFNAIKVEISSSAIPVTASVQGEPSQRADVHTRVENLLFHASFIVPAIILRILSKVISAAAGKRVGESCVGRAALHLIEPSWVLFERLLQFVVRTFGLGGFYWTFSVVYGEA